MSCGMPGVPQMPDWSNDLNHQLGLAQKERFCSPVPKGCSCLVILTFTINELRLAVFVSGGNELVMGEEGRGEIGSHLPKPYGSGVRTVMHCRNSMWDFG